MKEKVFTGLMSLLMAFSHIEVMPVQVFNVDGETQEDDETSVVLDVDTAASAIPEETPASGEEEVQDSENTENTENTIIENTDTVEVTLSYEGDDYSVTASFDSNALPEGTELKVERIEDEEILDEEQYVAEQYLSYVLTNDIAHDLKVDAESLTVTPVIEVFDLFDISFVFEGNEVEAEDDVRISLTVKNDEDVYDETYGSLVLEHQEELISEPDGSVSSSEEERTAEFSVSSDGTYYSLSYGYARVMVNGTETIEDESDEEDDSCDHYYIMVPEESDESEETAENTEVEALYEICTFEDHDFSEEYEEDGTLHVNAAFKNCGKDHEDDVHQLLIEKEECPAVTLEGEAGDVHVQVEAPEGALPEGVEMVLTLVAEEEIFDVVQEAVTDRNVTKVTAVDITFVNQNGEQIEPRKQIKVTMTSAVVQEAEEDPVVVHVADDGMANVVEAEKETEDAMSFESRSFSIYVIAQTISTTYITASGETYTITVTYTEDAGIPEGSELKVREIEEDDDDYLSYFEETNKMLQEDESKPPVVSNAIFFDIEIQKDGEKIEPAVPVEVKIEQTKSVKSDESDQVSIIHFADEGTELITEVQSNGDGTELVYEQSSFSIIGVVVQGSQYTGWVANGKYVLVLTDGTSYYAIKHDGSLQEVDYVAGSVSFLGDGTDDESYLDDFLWDIYGEYTSEYDWLNQKTVSYTKNGKTYYLDPEAKSSSYISTTKTYLNVTSGNLLEWYWNGSYWCKRIFEISNGKLTVNSGPHWSTSSSTSPVFVNDFTVTKNTNGFFTDDDIQKLLENYKKMVKSELISDKTAEVYDYENRIYEVDLSVSSAYYAMDPSINLEFVVDSSRSMYFPSEIHEVGSYDQIEDLSDWLDEHEKEGIAGEVYFIKYDPQKTATLYAIYYRDGDWYWCDASQFNPPDEKSNEFDSVKKRINNKYKKFIPNNTTGTDGKIYQTTYTGKSSYPSKVSGVNNGKNFGTRYKWTSRLEYLVQAVKVASEVIYMVDDEAEIGLIDFNMVIEDHRYYTEEQKSALYQELKDITGGDGTNQKAALEKAVEKYNEVSDKDKDHVVVLITDGAPNYTTTGDSWSEIGEVADTLKAMKNKYGDTTDLYTIGLSLKDVGDNAEELKEIATQAADGSYYSYDAESPAEIIDAITRIIQNVLHEASVAGNVTDTIDSAFYPVTSDGTVLNSGDWITLAGAKTTAGAKDAAGKVVQNDDGTWTVTWTNQTITWPESITNDDGTVTVQPGWHGTIYVKAKEDFLGGNAISTNTSAEIQLTTLIREKGLDKDILKTTDPVKLDTPYVNVDDLRFTETETEWTVYLGTEVDPLKEVQRQWNDISVLEVVTSSGEDHRNTGHMIYESSMSSDDDVKTQNADPEKFKLTDITGELTDEQWAKLLNGETLEFDYNAYGHEDVGVIKVTLKQEVVTGEEDLDPSPHDTTVVGEAVEKYTLVVTYEPNDPEVEEYHTGIYATKTEGKKTDNIVSTNIHVINVFAKKLQVQKVDKNGKVIEEAGVTFKLYRKAAADELKDSTVTTTEVTIGTEKVECIEMPKALVTDSDGITNLSDYLPLLDMETVTTSGGTTEMVPQYYYLVETFAPTGYTVLETPLAVLVSVDETNSIYTWKMVNAEETAVEVKPIGYDWEETLDQASITILDGELAYKKADEAVTDSGSTTTTTVTVEPVHMITETVVPSPNITENAAKNEDNTVTYTYTYKVDDKTSYTLSKASDSDLYIYQSETASDGTYFRYELNVDKSSETPVYTLKKYEIKPYDTSVYCVKNMPLYELPSSGGIGTYLYTLIGTMFLTMALLLYSKNRRKGVHT